MWSFFAQGGPIMFILLLLSFYGVYIVVQKFLFIKANELKDDIIISRLKQQLVSSGKEACLRELDYDKRLMVRVLSHIIKVSDAPKGEIQSAIKHETKEDIQTLEKDMDALSTIVTVSPILGLLGTVIGLIDIFNVISGGGIGDPLLLSGGIAQALVTTVTGLSIAVPFIFLHQIFSKKIDLFIAKTETYANEILQFCKTNGGIKP